MNFLQCTRNDIIFHGDVEILDLLMSSLNHVCALYMYNYKLVHKKIISTPYLQRPKNEQINVYAL